MKKLIVIGLCLLIVHLVFINPQSSRIIFSKQPLLVKVLDLTKYLVITTVKILWQGVLRAAMRNLDMLKPEDGCKHATQPPKTFPRLPPPAGWGLNKPIRLSVHLFKQFFLVALGGEFADGAVDGYGVISRPAGGAVVVRRVF